MESLIIPSNYHSELNLYETQVAIKTVKDFFQNLLATRLNLTRVSAPLFVDSASGLNDNLNGVERPVSFDIKYQPEKHAEIVHSLAKWKRYALYKYGFSYDEGIYTDMNAIRRDEETDNIHSIFVDQWDWEKVIDKEDRTLETLKDVVKTVYKCLRKTEKYMAKSPLYYKKFRCQQTKQKQDKAKQNKTKIKQTKTFILKYMFLFSTSISNPFYYL